MFSGINFVTHVSMGDSTLVLVHPDAAIIPDDGGSLSHLGIRCVVHRDPAASLADLQSSDTAAVLFAAQLDSGLPSQVCEITAQGKEQPHFPVFFWGPGGSPAHLDALFKAGASDCFPESLTLEEVTVRIAHHLRQGQVSSNPPQNEELATTYYLRLRELAHDLKNPLCVLYGYAQMAQMGHPITPDEAKDMVESSREMRGMIDSALASMSEETATDSAANLDEPAKGNSNEPAAPELSKDSLSH